MARVKISEFRAKKLLAHALGTRYDGQEIELDAIPDSLPPGVFAVKVDQAIKKRNQLGLVKLGDDAQAALRDLGSYKELGYSYGLVEPLLEHSAEDEGFLAFDRTEAGISVSYARRGGVDIEERPDDVVTFVLVAGPKRPWAEHIENIEPAVLESLLQCFEASHMAYLEINPFVIHDGLLVPLDAAIEVDSAAEFIVKGAWTKSDIREPKMAKTAAEEQVEAIAASSPASFSLRVLNPQGSVFLLLSGGGASVVLADELSHAGLAAELANYGEYSGNPSDEETYGYTMALLDLMKASEAANKILIIAGGVANFTDIAKTFSGIIKALRKEADYLKTQKVAVYVRRGGPNQAAGLLKMDSFLKSLGLDEHAVYGPEMSLAAFIESIAAKKGSS
jgi:succinyl-CoA synthetase beta subunit